MTELHLPLRTRRLVLRRFAPGDLDESTQVDKWHYKGQWATEVVYAILGHERKARRPE